MIERHSHDGHDSGKEGVAPDPIVYSAIGAWTTGSRTMESLTNDAAAHLRTLIITGI